MCSPFTKIALGAFEVGLIGADSFNSFHRFLVLFLFFTIFSLKRTLHWSII